MAQIDRIGDNRPGTDEGRGPRDTKVASWVKDIKPEVKITVKVPKLEQTAAQQSKAN